MIGKVMSTVGAKWLWDKYGENIINKAYEGLKNQWAKFKWDEAEKNYRSHLKEIYSTTHILGNPKSVSIDEIYSEVYIMDQITAFKRYSLQEIKDRPFGDNPADKVDRKLIMNMLGEKRLFILGKPGAGKTTLLKYLTIQACDGIINQTPIYISLNEWAESGIEDIFEYISKQFTICSFPDPNGFIEELLNDEAHRALVLFDGLDEIKQEANLRSHVIKKLIDFSRKYRDAHIIITCRTASVEFSFDQFSYLEIADFDKSQIGLFARKWYKNDGDYQRFIKQIQKPINKGLLELAKTPLLLALLCLAFDEILTFPERRTDLYKEALDALLKKWDASRGIQRDEIYHSLSVVRKEQLLSRIAAQNFESGDFAFSESTLVNQINQYLHQLPESEISGFIPDGEAVLKSIEAQHGILVERAFKIFTFSHLSFQEYYTSRFIIENSGDGTIKRLCNYHLFDDRWHEIFLLTASQLDNADILLGEIIRISKSQLIKNKVCKEFFAWINRKAIESTIKPVEIRNALLIYALPRSLYNLYPKLRNYKLEPVKFYKEINQTQFIINQLLNTINQGLNIYNRLVISSNKLINEEIIIKSTFNDYPYDDYIYQQRIFAETSGIDLSINDIQVFRDFPLDEIESILKYLNGINLFLDCLNLSVVTDREKWKDQLFVLE